MILVEVLHAKFCSAGVLGKGIRFYGLFASGYDAHWRDPLGGFQYQTVTFHHLSQSIYNLAKKLCGGKCVFLLEGGYDLKALGESVVDSMLGVLGESSIGQCNPDLFRDEPVESVKAILNDARALHSL